MGHWWSHGQIKVMKLCFFSPGPRTSHKKTHVSQCYNLLLKPRISETFRNFPKFLRQFFCLTTSLFFFSWALFMVTFFCLNINKINERTKQSFLKCLVYFMLNKWLQMPAQRRQSYRVTMVKHSYLFFSKCEKSQTICCFLREIKTFFFTLRKKFG
jgi:hypothetical protein